MKIDDFDAQGRTVRNPSITQTVTDVPVRQGLQTMPKIHQTESSQVLKDGVGRVDCPDPLDTRREVMAVRDQIHPWKPKGRK